MPLHTDKKRRRRRRRRGGRGFGKLRRDLGKADELFRDTLDFGPLSRVDDTRSTEVQNLLNQFQSLSDPSSAAFAGRRSEDTKEFVSRLREGLKGFDSSELTALREQRKGELDRGFQGGRAALARGQSGFRTGGTARAAQLAELAKNFGRTTAEAENDLFVQGAEEKRRALGEFGSNVQKIEGLEAARGRQALADFRAALETDRADRFDRQKFNLGQEATDRALRSGGILGLLGVVEGRRGAKRQNRLAREQIASNEAIARLHSQAQAGGNEGLASAIEALLARRRAETEQQESG